MALLSVPALSRSLGSGQQVCFSGRTEATAAERQHSVALHFGRPKCTFGLSKVDLFRVIGDDYRVRELTAATVQLIPWRIYV
jgi:hypothetical protein